MGKTTSLLHHLEIMESAYLAGVAAANTTKTNKVGFIGGVEGPVIGRFQAGFEKV